MHNDEKRKSCFNDIVKPHNFFNSLSPLKKFRKVSVVYSNSELDQNPNNDNTNKIKIPIKGTTQGNDINTKMIHNSIISQFNKISEGKLQKSIKIKDMIMNKVKLNHQSEIVQEKAKKIKFTTGQCDISNIAVKTPIIIKKKFSLKINSDSSRKIAKSFENFDEHDSTKDQDQLRQSSLKRNSILISTFQRKDIQSKSYSKLPHNLLDMCGVSNSPIKNRQRHNQTQQDLSHVDDSLKKLTNDDLRNRLNNNISNNHLPLNIKIFDRPQDSSNKKISSPIKVTNSLFSGKLIKARPLENDSDNNFMQTHDKNITESIILEENQEDTDKLEKIVSPIKPIE